MKLFPYQVADVSKLQDMPRALIGHEQGLGKTAITAQLVRPGTLVICPSSLRLNWERELGIWRPELDVQVVRSRQDRYDGAADVIVASYDLVQHCDLPACYTLVVDESHYCKNRQAKRSQRVAWYAEHADNVYLLTGTPMPNRTRELWTQLRMLRATELTYSQFTRKYSDAHDTPWGWDDSGASNLDQLRNTLKPILVRRKKADVLSDLPPKTHQIVEIEAPVSQREMEIGNQVAQAIREHGRLIATSVPFEELSEYRRLTGERKVAHAVEHAKTLLESVDKLIIFAHHKDIIATLVKELEEFDPVQITGDTSLETRQANVDDFQTNACTRVFIGNIQAAGTGITLTAASTVLFVELDWVPGNLFQAADRAHRIGQRDNVLVQYLVTRDGLDHRLMEAILEKEEVINEVIDGEVA